MWRVKLILNLNGGLIQMEPWVEQGLMTRKQPTHSRIVQKLGWPWLSPAHYHLQAVYTTSSPNATIGSILSSRCCNYLFRSQSINL